MNYLEKYTGHYGRRSVDDILRLNPQVHEDWEVIKSEYRAVDIDKVVIDGDTFTNYGSFQFAWEKSYIKSPVRSNGGAIENLNSYATFVTPHLIINFSIMSIDDYRALMRKDLERNEFVVECYDPIYNQRITAKMYLGTAEMAKLRTINRKRFNGLEWEEFIELFGVESYTVDLIGTNNDLDLVSVIYHLNPPADTGYADYTLGEDDVYRGQEIVIGSAAGEITSQTFGGAYSFNKWNTSANGGEQGNYINNNSYTINSTLVLYAQWGTTNEHILSFNYGLADASINDLTYTYETSRKVQYGQSIGILPVAETPKVVINDTKYYPYYNGKWYNTPIKVNNSVAISDNELYWSDRDSTIYLLYDVYSYTLNLYLDGTLYQSNSIEYNTPMNLPILVKSGYTFDGWYSTADFQSGTKVSGNMPPYSLTLYARWIAQ
jgi:uncharacterized repeat protein (TIGR02543 family)